MNVMTLINVKKLLTSKCHFVT